MFLKKDWALYLSERSMDNTIGFHIEDKPLADDMQRYHSVVEGTIAQFDHVRLLFAFDNLSRAGLDEMWDDMKSSARYMDDVERIAVVGEAQVKEWLESLQTGEAAPDVRYFECDEYDAAWEWLGDDE